MTKSCVCLRNQLYYVKSAQVNVNLTMLCLLLYSYLEKQVIHAGKESESHIKATITTGNGYYCTGNRLRIIAFTGSKQRGVRQAELSSSRFSSVLQPCVQRSAHILQTLRERSSRGTLTYRRTRRCRRDATSAAYFVHV